MIAEYAFAYGGPPPPETPWPLFIALVRRVCRFDARRLLFTMIGTAWGAQKLFPGSHGELEMIRERVKALAYGEEPRLALKQSADDE